MNGDFCTPFATRSRGGGGLRGRPGPVQAMRRGAPLSHAVSRGRQGAAGRQRGRRGGVDGADGSRCSPEPSRRKRLGRLSRGPGDEGSAGACGQGRALGSPLRAAPSGRSHGPGDGSVHGTQSASSNGPGSGGSADAASTRLGPAHQASTRPMGQHPCSKPRHPTRDLQDLQSVWEGRGEMGSSPSEIPAPCWPSLACSGWWCLGWWPSSFGASLLGGFPWLRAPGGPPRS